MLKNYVDIFKNNQQHVYLLGLVDRNTRELREPTDAALGTAFAVSKEGHFLTAFHVIKDHYKKIIDNKMQICLKGSHGHGIPDEPAFGVEVLDVFKEFDIALLKGDIERGDFIRTAARLSLPGAWIGTIGYPLSHYDATKEQVIVGKRFVSAMISRSLDVDGVKMVELDKHLSHGHSGGPIITQKGIAMGIAIAYDKGWTLVNEMDKDGKIAKRFFQLPVQFSKGTLILNVVKQLRKQGVPVLEKKIMIFK